MKKIKEKIKELKPKDIYIIVGVILLVILLVFVIVKKNQSDDVDNSQKKVEALLPDSEQNKVAENKVEAYKDEDSEQKKREREREASIVKNSDFFKDVVGDDDDKLKEGEKIEDFYERTVVTKGKKSNNTEYRKNNTTTSKKTFAYDENDQIEEMHYEAVSVPKRPKEKAVQTESNTSGKKTSLADRLSKKTETNEETVFEQEADPRLYGRTRRRNSVQADQSNLIKACIHGDQTVTNGANVRMRTLEEAQISGVTIPKNTLFYGIAQIQSERLSIKVSAIKINDNIHNVKFTIYDNDAIQGLNLPDNTKAELAKQSKMAAVDQVGVNTGGQGIVGSVVSSSINTAKQVFKRDQQQIKVELKTNYQIFIKEN